MVSSLLQGLQSRAGAAAAVKQRVIDDADAVVELNTPLYTAVVFPTADTLPEVRGPRLFLTAGNTALTFLWPDS